MDKARSRIPTPSLVERNNRLSSLLLTAKLSLSNVLNVKLRMLISSGLLLLLLLLLFCRSASLVCHFHFHLSFVV